MDANRIRIKDSDNGVDEYRCTNSNVPTRDLQNQKLLYTASGSRGEVIADGPSTDMVDSLGQKPAKVHDLGRL